jgi:hypothetical protein
MGLRNQNMNKIRMRSAIMPFGKYKGRYLGEIPKDYLHWVLRSCDGLDQRFCDAIRVRLKETKPSRESHEVHVSVAPPVERPKATLRLETLQALNTVQGLIRNAYRETLIEYRLDNEDSFLAIEALDKFQDAIEKILIEQLGNP